MYQIEINITRKQLWEFIEAMKKDIELHGIVESNEFSSYYLLESYLEEIMLEIPEVFSYLFKGYINDDIVNIDEINKVIDAIVKITGDEAIIGILILNELDIVDLFITFNTEEEQHETYKILKKFFFSHIQEKEEEDTKIISIIKKVVTYMSFK